MLQVRHDLRHGTFFETQVLARTGCAQMRHAHGRVGLDQGKIPTKKAQSIDPQRRLQFVGIRPGNRIPLLEPDAFDPVLDVQGTLTRHHDPADLQRPALGMPAKMLGAGDRLQQTAPVLVKFQF